MGFEYRVRDAGWGRGGCGCRCEGKGRGLGEGLVWGRGGNVDVEMERGCGILLHQNSQLTVSKSYPAYPPPPPNLINHHHLLFLPSTSLLLSKFPTSIQQPLVQYILCRRFHSQVTQQTHHDLDLNYFSEGSLSVKCDIRV